MKSFEKLDWKLIASIDPSSCIQNLDYETLQSLVKNISSCDVESETDAKIDPCFVKVFDLSKNIIKYLLSAEDCLLQQIQNVSEELEKEKQVTKDKLKLENDIENKFKRKISNLKSELQQKDEMLLNLNLNALASQSIIAKNKHPNVAEQKESHAAIPVSEERSPIYPCHHCSRMFSSKNFLQSHVTRRHTQTSASKVFSSEQASNNYLDSSNENPDFKYLCKELEAMKETSMQLHTRLQKKLICNPTQELGKQLEISNEQLNLQKRFQKSLDLILKNYHYIDNRTNNTQLYTSLQQQISELKIKLETREDENVLLVNKLKDTELQTRKRASQLTVQAWNEDVIKRKLEDEFDSKLEFLKEEQKMDYKCQLERLQNSFMHEMKLMRLKQMETTRTLEEVKKMRLPGNCLGTLEDDVNDDYHGDNINVDYRDDDDGATKYSKRRIDNHVGLNKGTENERHDKNIIQKRTYNCMKYPLYIEYPKMTDKYTKPLVNAIKIPDANTPHENTLKVPKKNIMSLGQADDTPPIVLRPNVNVLKMDREFTSDKKLKTKYSPKNSNHSNLEEIKTMIDKELHEKMTEYGLPKNCSEITKEDYLQILQKINDDVSHLSQELQENYIIYKYSLESELESLIEKLIPTLKGCHHGDHVAKKYNSQDKNQQTLGRMKAESSIQKIQFKNSKSLPAQVGSSDEPQALVTTKSSPDSKAINNSGVKYLSNFNQPIGNRDDDDDEEEEKDGDDDEEEEEEDGDDDDDVSLTTISDVQKITKSEDDENMFVDNLDTIDDLNDAMSIIMAHNNTK